MKLGPHTERSDYLACVIKSFKHDGSLHRVWLDNWQVPPDRLLPEHAAEGALVFLNERTPIREADGTEWVSRVPAVSIFMPKLWFNVVALIEDRGIRYYCNAASPPLRYDNVLTYIDYDLDLVLQPDGAIRELDRDEFDRHRAEYRYDEQVLEQVEQGLAELRRRMGGRLPPFGDAGVAGYYNNWKTAAAAREERDDR